MSRCSPSGPSAAFSIAIIERVLKNGTPCLAYEILFEADARVAVLTASPGTGLTTTTLTCTLPHGQGHALWEALTPRCHTAQECAWHIHLGPRQGLLCVGVLTEIAMTEADAAHHRYTLIFTDSDAQTIPWNHDDTTPLPN